MSAVDLAADSRFATAEGRLAHQDALDEALGVYTRRRRVDELVIALREAGIAAGPSASAEDLYRDPHLAARGFFYEVEHPVAGRRRIAGPATRVVGAMPASLPYAPLLGQHNDEVLGALAPDGQRQPP